MFIEERQFAVLVIISVLAQVITQRTKLNKEEQIYRH